MLMKSTGRAMNHMDPETRAVHVALERWGRVCRDHLQAWPSMTILGRVIEFGLMGASQQGRPPISLPEDVAAMDAAIARLAVIDRRAVTMYYTRQHETIERCADRLGMSERHLRTVLRHARFRLALALKV